jgi:hypothetical protein
VMSTVSFICGCGFSRIAFLICSFVIRVLCVGLRILNVTRIGRGH